MILAYFCGSVTIQPSISEQVITYKSCQLISLILEAQVFGFVFFLFDFADCFSFETVLSTLPKAILAS